MIFINCGYCVVQSFYKSVNFAIFPDGLPKAKIEMGRLHAQLEQMRTMALAHTMNVAIPGSAQVHEGHIPVHHSIISSTASVGRGGGGSIRSTLGAHRPSTMSVFGSTMSVFSNTSISGPAVPRHSLSPSIGTTVVLRAHPAPTSDEPKLLVATSVNAEG